MPDIVTRMVLRGWGVRVVVVSVVAVLATGCNGEGELVVSPTPTLTAPVVESPEPSPSPTPRQTPVALSEEEILAALPEEVRERSLFGAVYFSQFFLELYAEMLGPGHDTRLFAQLSAPECDFCESSLGTAQAQREVGAFSEGGDFSWSYDILEYRGGLRDDGYWYIEQPFEVTDTFTYGKSGELLGESPGGAGSLTTKLALDNEYWRVLGVNLEFEDN